MNEEPEISGAEAPNGAAESAPATNNGDELSLFGGAATTSVTAAAPLNETSEGLGGDLPTSSTSPAVPPASAGLSAAGEAPLRPDGPAVASDRTTRVQGGPGTGWCPRCKAEVPTRGFCPVCGSQTGPPQPEKRLTGSGKLDVFLGFVYFWALYVLTFTIPPLFNKTVPGLGLLLGTLLFFIVPVTAIIVFTRPRFAYRAFGRGITYGAISFGVLILGAFLTCIGFGVTGALRF